MTHAQLDTLTEHSIATIKAIAAFISSEAGRIAQKDIEHKGVHDLVTFVDKTSEEKLVKGLSALLPEAGFIAEEGTIAKKGERYNWVIDPLDGTTNFIHGIPCYAISVALVDKDEVILGVVYEITRKECFHAHKFSPAFLNEKEIHVTGTQKLNDSLIATGFPYTNFDQLEEYLKVFRHLMLNTRGIRRIGSAATDLCYAACGRFDGFFEYGLKPWDVAAGSFIVKQAGGNCCDFKGKENFIEGREIIAGNPFITKELLFSFQEFFV
ncbi:MAG TPA: inositol monophosphatase family protein [Bacteroidia bacterium]